jgi:hypothetical protein
MEVSNAILVKTSQFNALNLVQAAPTLRHAAYSMLIDANRSA